MVEIFVQHNYRPPPEAWGVLNAQSQERPLRVVDLGGNIGLFALYVFQAFPNAHVVSFEPDLANAALLTMTRDANSMHANWRLVTACAGASTGEVHFKAGDYLESCTVPADASDALVVPQVDVFPFLRGVDWLKLDIEGGEWELLLDPRFADAAVPVLSLEYHRRLCPSNSPLELATSSLTNAGYNIAPFEERADGLGEVWAWRASAADTPSSSPAPKGTMQEFCR